VINDEQEDEPYATLSSSDDEDDKVADNLHHHPHPTTDVNENPNKKQKHNPNSINLIPCSSKEENDAVGAIHTQEIDDFATNINMDIEEEWTRSDYIRNIWRIDHELIEEREGQLTSEWRLKNYIRSMNEWTKKFKEESCRMHVLPNEQIIFFHNYIQGINEVSKEIEREHDSLKSFSRIIACETGKLKRYESKLVEKGGNVAFIRKNLEIQRTNFIDQHPGMSDRINYPACESDLLIQQQQHHHNLEE
jgi:hypothetical protein